MKLLILLVFLLLLNIGITSDEEMFIICGGDEELKIGCVIGDSDVNPSLSISCGNGVCETFESCSSCVIDCGNCVSGQPDVDMKKVVVTEDEDVEEEKDFITLFIYNNWWLIILFILLFFVTLWFFFVYKRKKKEEGEDNN